MSRQDESRTPSETRHIFFITNYCSEAFVNIACKYVNIRGYVLLDVEHSRKRALTDDNPGPGAV